MDAGVVIGVVVFAVFFLGCGFVLGSLTGRMR